jgi:hypothetical protein
MTPIPKEHRMSAVIVRYRVKPGRAEENAELIRAVYAELAQREPAGFHYATFVQEDGVTFVHVGMTDDGHEPPLPQLPAFQRFTEAIAERCDSPPETTRLPTQIGSYGL